jgi:hypothetical protein
MLEANVVVINHREHHKYTPKKLTCYFKSPYPDKPDKPDKIQYNQVRHPAQADVLDQQTKKDEEPSKHFPRKPTYLPTYIDKTTRPRP